MDKYAKEVRLVNPEMMKIRITPHTMRHSKATHLYQAGVPLKDISLFLGHSSVVTTEIYAKVSPEQAMRGIDKVNQALMRDVVFSSESKDELLDWFDSEIMNRKGKRRRWATKASMSES